MSATGRAEVSIAAKLMRKRHESIERPFVLVDLAWWNSRMLIVVLSRRCLLSDRCVLCLVADEAWKVFRYVQVVKSIGRKLVEIEIMVLKTVKPILHHAH